MKRRRSQADARRSLPAACEPPLRLDGFFGEDLVHVARRLGAAGLADNARRHAGDGLVVRHRRQHDRAGGDARAMADLDIAENLRARADQHAVADLRMAVAGLLAGAAQRHALQDRDVVLDHRRLADDEAGRVVEEDALADARGRD